MKKWSGSFDMTLVSDVDDSVLTSENHHLHESDLLMLSSLKLNTFAKVVVLKAGTLILHQLDHIFDDVVSGLGCIDVLVTNENGTDWRVARFQPCSKKLARMHLSGKALKKWSDFPNNAVTIKGLVHNCKDAKSLADWDTYVDDRVVYVNKTNAELFTKLETANWLPMKKLLKPEEYSKDWTAIVGMSCRLPDANSPEDYWDILKDGRNTCAPPPEHRLALVDMDSEAEANFLKCPVDQFDAAFFGMSPSEAIATDPQLRLLLEVSWEAFEDARINPEVLKGTKTGVFLGSWLQDYREKLIANQPPSANDMFFRTYLRNGFGVQSAKLSFFYGFKGPSISTESGCSSSMVAVDMAIKSLQRRECPVALACGTNLMLFNRRLARVMAEDGKSRPFDVSADGFGRAEGIAILVLKRFSDAVRDNDHIHGIIRGSATSQEGLCKSFGTPTIENEICVMRDALLSARVDPIQVDYVEAHATGTVVGDPIEAAAIVKAYGGCRSEYPIWIGSSKANIGHPESCSGIAGLIKVLLAMKHETIPRHINLTKLNPKIDFSPINGKIPTHNVDWPRRVDRPRIAGVSSFGITGTDVHLVIQESPYGQYSGSLSSCNKAEDRYETQLLPISAKTEIALKQFANQFCSFLESSTDSLENICFSASAHRPHHKYRYAVLATSKEEMVENIKRGHLICSADFEMLKKDDYTDKNICFVFPGRISQVDMKHILHLYNNNKFFRNIMNYCHTTFSKVTGYLMPVSSLLKSSEEYNKSPEMDAEVGQDLLFSIQYSLAKLWIHWGLEPSTVMGHCAGEIMAAVICSIISLEEAYTIIKMSSHLVQCQREQPVFVLAVKSDQQETEQIIDLFLRLKKKQEPLIPSLWLDISGVISKKQTLVIGPVEIGESFINFCTEHGIYCKVLPINLGMHSRAVETARDSYMPVFNQLSHRPIKIPYISSVTGMVMLDNEMNGDFWYRVIRGRVNFKQACTTASKKNLANIFIEIGVSEVLTKSIESNVSFKDNTRTLCVATFPQSGILSTVGELYSFGVNLNWKAMYNDGKDNLFRIKLPNYPFQKRSYWYERNALKSTRVCPQVHPLLGVVMEKPANLENLELYKNESLDCSDFKTKFIQDHILGTVTIFPAAGYLEMILAAWNLSDKRIAQQKELITIVNFKILAPLQVGESVQTSAQCVVNRENGSVSVFASDGNGRPWKLHAEGQIPRKGCHLPEGEILCGKMDVDWKSILEQSKDYSMSGDNFYSGLAQAGLKYGKCFRFISRILSFAGDNQDSAIEFEIPINNYTNDFICHPLLVDAMIQTLLYHKGLHLGNLRKLLIPVGIESFTVLCRPYRSISGKWYVYCENQTGQLTLFNHEFRLVAVMKTLKLIPTTIETVLAAVKCSISNATVNGSDIVGIYVDSWQPAQFYQPSHGQPHEPRSENRKSSTDELQASLDALNPFTPEEAELDGVLNRLGNLYVTRAILDLGWKPEMMKFDDIHKKINKFVQLFDILPGMLRAFKHYVKAYLKTDKYVPTLHQVEQEIQASLEHPLAKAYPAIDTIHLCGSNLANAIRGTVSAQKLMFGEDSHHEKFGINSRYSKIQKPLEEMFLHLVGSGKENGCFKILEIGAGSGAFTKGIVTRMRKEGVEFEYHFTDISFALVNKAKTLFAEEDKAKFIFKVLNIELDPLAQGFPPAYFDVVVAYEVLHATRDLKETLTNVALLTRMGGSVLLGETEKPLCEIDICYGIFDGYWRFQDDIRSDHCTISADKWLELLDDAGFSGNPCKILSCGGQKSVIAATRTEVLKRRNLPAFEAKNTWILLNVGGEGCLQEFKRNVELLTNRHVIVLDVSMEGNKLKNILSSSLLETKEALEGILIWMLGENGMQTREVEPNSRKVLESILYLSKHLLEMKLLPRVVAVTDGCWQNLDAPKINGKGVSSAQVWGFLRSLRLELSKIRSTLIDLNFGTPRNEQICQILANMWLEDNEVEVKYGVDGTRQVRRITSAKNTTFADLTFPNRGQYRVKLPDSKNINDVEFEEMPENEMCGDGQIKVEVCSVSLNFKDVLAILKPSKDFKELSSIGLDFSGVVVGVGGNVSRWKIGDSVFGCDLTGKCMQSQVTVDQNGVISVPPEMSFSEAATLPAVFLTAWYCMTNLAKLQKGQTVLIHAASGGVGLAAIQIAKLLGVTLIGTAGSERKRRFLRGVGMEHVFNSRDLEFKEGIEKVTMGRGVDMVLNCLTGPGFKEASLDVCRDGGHFVEISKMDIWTEEEVKLRRPLVFYNIVDMTMVDGGICLDLLSTLSTFLKEGKITPLHHTVYPAIRLVDALVHLQKARQIGKVVINMPRLVEGERSQFLFDDKSTYLITGGMGAIWFAICRWMISKGAKYVVLIGRNEPNHEIGGEIRKLNSEYDSHVITRQLDISDYQQCEKFIKEELRSSNLPPLRGIHHCAVALSDKMIASHDWHSFQNVFQAKVAGAWNLHRCTLNLPLQFFVLHSSAVATFGNLGQSNYAAANAYLDAFAKYRYSCGLSGLSINWGAWGSGLSKDVTLNWAPNFSEAEGIQTLERIMNEYQHESNIVAGVFNFPLIREKLPQYASLLENPALNQLRSNGSPCLTSADKNAEKIISSEEFAKYLQQEDPEERYKLVRSCVLQVICDTMGILEDIPEDLPLSELGMDSLMTIEISNKLAVLVRDFHKRTDKQENEMKDVEVHLEADTTFRQMTKYMASILQV